MKIRGILFDLDGTLANSYHLGYNSTNVVLRNNGYGEISEEEYHEGSKLATPNRFAWHVTRDSNHQIGIKLGKEFDDLYVQLVSLETTPFYPGIKEMLRKVKEKFPSIKYGALSNASTEYVVEVLKVNGFSTDFSVILGANAVPAPKPSGLGLLKCAEVLGLEVSECLFIGDAPTDGLAARNAGKERKSGEGSGECVMKSIGVTWGSHSLEAIQSSFTHIVRTVEELSSHLEELLSNSS